MKIEDIMVLMITTNGKFKVRISFKSHIAKYLEYLVNENDSLHLIFITKNRMINVDIFINEKKYRIELIKNNKYWVSNLYKNDLLDLFVYDSIVEIESNPSKFNFTQQNGLEINCNNKKKIVGNIDFIVQCIEYLKNNEIIYIYDYDTTIRFSIEIYKGIYSFGMINYYKDFDTKEELIVFLKKDGLSIFEKIQINPEKYGFEFHDDGGM